MRLENVATGSHSLHNRIYNKQFTAVKDRSVGQNMEQEMYSSIHKKDVESLVSKMNDFFEPHHTNLKFQFHDELKEYYVTVVDPVTNEVIKEIPPKKFLDMYASMAEFMGLLIDEKI